MVHSRKIKKSGKVNRKVTHQRGVRKMKTMKGAGFWNTSKELFGIAKDIWKSGIIGDSIKAFREELQHELKQGKSSGNFKPIEANIKNLSNKTNIENIEKLKTDTKKLFNAILNDKTLLGKPVLITFCMNPEIYSKNQECKSLIDKINLFINTSINEFLVTGNTHLLSLDIDQLNPKQQQIASILIQIFMKKLMPLLKPKNPAQKTITTSTGNMSFEQLFNEFNKIMLTQSATQSSRQAPAAPATPATPSPRQAPASRPSAPAAPATPSSRQAPRPAEPVTSLPTPATPSPVTSEPSPAVAPIQSSPVIQGNKSGKSNANASNRPNSGNGNANASNRPNSGKGNANQAIKNSQAAVEEAPVAPEPVALEEAAPSAIEAEPAMEEPVSEEAAPSAEEEPAVMEEPAMEEPASEEAEAPAVEEAAPAVEEAPAAEPVATTGGRRNNNRKKNKRTSKKHKKSKKNHSKKQKRKLSKNNRNSRKRV